MRGIENDASGIEMTFTAIGNAAQKYQKYRTGSPRRNVMLVVVSDEVGNDESQADATLALCRRKRCRFTSWVCRRRLAAARRW